MPERLQGCCRDHTLLCVGVLRQHDVPTRSRVGFASYFRPDWNHMKLLLWDGWGAMGPDAEGADELVDEIATLLVAADAGDAAAEAELVDRYRADPRLHPGDRIQSFSPYGEIVEVSLARL